MYRKISLLFASFGFFAAAYCQLPYGLFDGRTDGRCADCLININGKPREVLFGIFIQANGDVYFSMDNKEWFNRIINSDSYAISADIVEKSRYDCNNTHSNENQVVKGFLMQPMYRPQLLANLSSTSDGNVYIKLGRLPDKYKNKELEGNLVMINYKHICYYTNFVNIKRNLWDLLPMGLYSDSLINTMGDRASKQIEFFTYDKKLQATIPFEKNKTAYKEADVRALYDSLQLHEYRIKKIEIRSYASVEGPEATNVALMKGRAKAMIDALRKVQPTLGAVRTVTAENWLEFREDIRKTSFAELGDMSKNEIKLRLNEKEISNQLEPVLAKHRKAIVTVYLEKKSAAAGLPTATIISSFNRAVEEKNVGQARMILKEIVNRISGNQLPSDYISKLAIPRSVEYIPLLGDEEIYRYLLLQSEEYEALENFLAIRKIDSLNGRVNYNINVLRFMVWQKFGDTTSRRELYSNIDKLQDQGIHNNLVKRMQINYHILMCMEYMKNFRYADKDRSLLFIRENYQGLPLTDDDRYSLAKYFAYYAHQEWAEEIIKPRIDQLDVSENLVFYYVNLGFYYPDRYSDPNFQKAVINAINVNRQRFCNFFLSTNRGGASMQLLDYPALKDIYCENCRMSGNSNSYEIASTMFH